MNYRKYVMTQDWVNNTVVCTNGAGKVVAKLNPKLKGLKVLCQGRPSITVKADIIDGVFTVQKVLK